MATKIVVKSFNSIPSTGSRGDILILKDSHRSGKFIYKGYGKDNNGTIKNGWHRVFTGRVDIRWFGIKSNIKKDYKIILEYIFNNFNSINIPKGIYYSSEIAIDNQVDIRGLGTLKLISKMRNIVNEQFPFIRIDSTAKIEGITIDGSNKTAHGVELNSKDIVINRVVIKNIYSDKFGASAVGLSTHYGRVKILNSYIHHIYAQANGKIADSSGLARAIMVGAYNNVNISDMTLIEDCIFDSILGEEGDCIQSEAIAVGVIKSLTINRCEFSNFSRRAIKIAASNAVVTNCNIQNLKWYKHLHCAISAFGNNIKIENNKIDMRYARGIELGLEGNKKVKNYVIKGNSLKAFVSKIKYESYSIEVSNIINAIIDNNTVYRSYNESSAVALMGCKNIKVINNLFYGGESPAVMIGSNSYSKDENILVKNNKYFNTKTGYFLSADNTLNSRFENNEINSGSAKLYNIDSSCKNIIAR